MSAKSMFSTTIAAAAFALTSLTAGPAPARADWEGVELDHNGSTVTFTASRGTIVYSWVKPSLRGTIAEGDVLFRGKIDMTQGKISGTAYVFKRGCAPAPYAVTSVKTQLGNVKLVGAAPVRDPKSCAIIGSSLSSKNAVLEFTENGDI